MTKKIFSIIIVFLVFFVASCQRTPTFKSSESSSTSTLIITPTFIATPTLTITPTLIFTPSPTSTYIMVSRVIPKNYYIAVEMKYTIFDNDVKAKSICIFKFIQKVIKIESDEVVEIAEQVERQQVLGNCAPIPELKNIKLNVFTGEIIKTNPQDASSTYYGKNYRSSQDDIFTFSTTPISVWKIVEPFRQNAYFGTQEQLIDKSTGIVIYKRLDYQDVNTASIFLIEMISMRTNAPIGGLLERKEFSYFNTATSKPPLIEMPENLDGCKFYHNSTYDSASYNRAIFCYQLFTTLGSDDEKIESYLNIGMIYNQLGNYPMAIENLLAGLKIAKPNSSYQLNLYMWLGWSYKANEQKIEACEIFRQTLALAQKMNYGWIEGNSQTQINTYCQ